MPDSSARQARILQGLDLAHLHRLQIRINDALLKQLAKRQLSALAQNLSPTRERQSPSSHQR